MNFKIGDKVKFLNDVGGGKIISIIEKEKAVVETDDGFEMPVLLSELVKNADIYSYDASKLKRSFQVEEDDDDEIEEIVEKDIKIIPKNIEIKQPEIKKPIEQVEEMGEETEDIDPRHYIVITRESDDLFQVHLINDSNFSFFFNLLKKTEDLYYPVNTGMLEPNTKLFIARYSRKDVNQLLNFLIQGILYKKGIYEPVYPIHQFIEIKPLDLFSNVNWIENDYFNENAILYEIERRKSIEKEVNRLGNQEIQKIIHEKEESEKKRDEARKVKKATNEMVEIDLHIEELLDDHSGMTSGQIIEYQLKRFKSALDEALEKKTKKIVFIHGIGNGKLKLELRKTLDEKYHQVYYQDASFKEYGFGATMVIIK